MLELYNKLFLYNLKMNFAKKNKNIQKKYKIVNNEIYRETAICL